MLFLAIETTSIPLYVLTGFILRDQKSVEAGIKYLLFGSMASPFCSTASRCCTAHRLDPVVRLAGCCRQPKCQQY